MTARVYHAVNPGPLPSDSNSRDNGSRLFSLFTRALITLRRKIRDIDTAKDARDVIYIVRAVRSGGSSRHLEI